MNIVNSLIEKAGETPHFLAIRYPERGLFNNRLKYNDITFGKFLSFIEACSDYLKRKKVEFGDEVIIMVPPGKHLLVVAYALLKIGAIPVVIDPGMGVKNLKQCIDTVCPKHFICTAITSVFCSISGVFKKNCNRIVISSKCYDRASCVAVSKAVDNDGVAAVLFTSGSTGKPKGVHYTHEEFFSQIECLRNSFNIVDGEVDLPLLPVFSLFNPILGMTTVVPEINPAKPSKLNPLRAIEAIRMCNVTNSFGSPRLWIEIVKCCEQNGIILPSLKRVFIAGAPVNNNLLLRVQRILPNGTAMTPYGATESLPVSCIDAEMVLEKTQHITLVGGGTCVGFPLNGVDVGIIDIVDGAVDAVDALLPSRRIGEIIVSSRATTKSYINDDVSTVLAKVIYEGKMWHRMGDVGYLDDEGKLWFCGRKAERVVSNGRTFFTDCCEPIFNAHSNVFRSALIGITVCGETVPAIAVEPIYEPKNNAAFIDELRHLAANCATTRGIEHFFVYKNFPVDVRHNAKIHRLKLAQLLQP